MSGSRNTTLRRKFKSLSESILFVCGRTSSCRLLAVDVLKPVLQDIMALKGQLEFLKRLAHHGAATWPRQLNKTTPITEEVDQLWEEVVFKGAPLQTEQHAPSRQVCGIGTAQWPRAPPIIKNETRVRPPVHDLVEENFQGLEDNIAPEDPKNALTYANELVKARRGIARRPLNHGQNQAANVPKKVQGATRNARDVFETKFNILQRKLAKPPRMNQAQGFQLSSPWVLQLVGQSLESRTSDRCRVSLVTGESESR